MNQEQQANNEDTEQVANVAQLVECLPNMQEFSSQHQLKGGVAHA